MAPTPRRSRLPGGETRCRTASYARMPGPPTVLAALAGVCAAVAIVDLAGARGGAAAVARDAAEDGGAGGRHRLARALTRLGRRLGAPAPPEDLDARLAAAGRPLNLDAGDLMALKCGTAAAAALIALPLSSIAPGRLGLPLLVAAVPLGFVAPDAFLKRRAKRRQQQIEQELPDVCELLRVATDAGLNPARAIQEVGRRHPGLLGAELRRVAAETGLGVMQSDALERLTRRAPAPGVRTLVGALQRTATHGAPLGPALHALAIETRTHQARRTTEQAAKAAPKVQLIVALLLVPAVLLLVAAALLSALTGP